LSEQTGATSGDHEPADEALHGNPRAFAIPEQAHLRAPFSSAASDWL
jgi:hypothetical protein